MALILNKKENYISILGSDATFRKELHKEAFNTSQNKEDRKARMEEKLKEIGLTGAVVREYEASTGESGFKVELMFNELSGKITSIEMHEGNFGNNLQVTFTDTDGDVTLSVGTNTSFGEDFMKKLPSIDMTQDVVVKPYNFTDDRGKNMKGLSITQGDKKIENFFWDKEKKEGINGMPKPKGDTSKYNKDKWKIYFTEVKIFLEEYVTEKFASKTLKADTTANAVMEDLDKGIDPESISME